MSVEDIQKVNELAQELLKKNFVENREEAVKKAQEMLDKKITGEVPEREKEAEEQGKSPAFSKEKVKEEKPEEKEKQEKSTIIDDNSLKELRNKINQTEEYTKKQFANYKNALIALEKEIKKVKQQVDKINTSAPKDPAEEPQKVQDPAEEPQKVKKGQDHGNQTKSDSSQEEPQKVKDKKSNPRTGDNKSEDVSIEKMFYFGNK